MSDNPAPPDCPFNADTSGTKVKPYPGIYCNELWQNQDKNAVARLLELAPDSQDFTQIVLPMLQSGAKMSSASNGLMERNETLVRWWYRLVKLEYQLCYNAERYQLTGLTSGRKRSAFDFMGTVDFVYDIDIFRQALGQRKLSCWGLSYGTRVCGTYATIFPGRVSRMIWMATWIPDQTYSLLQMRLLGAPWLFSEVLQQRVRLRWGSTKQLMTFVHWHLSWHRK